MVHCGDTDVWLLPPVQLVGNKCEVCGLYRWRFLRIV